MQKRHIPYLNIPQADASGRDTPGSRGSVSSVDSQFSRESKSPSPAANGTHHSSSPYMTFRSIAPAVPAATPVAVRVAPKPKLTLDDAKKIEEMYRSIITLQKPETYGGQRLLSHAEVVGLSVETEKLEDKMTLMVLTDPDITNEDRYQKLLDYLADPKNSNERVFNAVKLAEHQLEKDFLNPYDLLIKQTQFAKRFT